MDIYAGSLPAFRAHQLINCSAKTSCLHLSHLKQLLQRHVDHVDAFLPPEDLYLLSAEFFQDRLLLSP
jgi:hypothetical protein